MASKIGKILVVDDNLQHRPLANPQGRTDESGH